MCRQGGNKRRAGDPTERTGMRSIPHSLSPVASIRGLMLTALALSASVLPANAGLFKAAPAPVSEFIEQPDQMTTEYRRRVPFNTYWRNPSSAAWNRVEGFNKMTVAPVKISYLRDRSDAFARNGRTEEEAIRLAAFTQTQFENRLARSGAYTVVRGEGPNTLVLELALIEMNPTNIAGNVVCTGASAVVPGAGIAGGVLTNGRIAIEGKLRNAETGELLIQFTDSARDKFTPFSFRDFTAYGHARAAISDWAKQFDALSRTPRTQRIHGSLALGVNPF